MQILRQNEQVVAWFSWLNGYGDYLDNLVVELELLSYFEAFLAVAEDSQRV